MNAEQREAAYIKGWSSSSVKLKQDPGDQGQVHHAAGLAEATRQQAFEDAQIVRVAADQLEDLVARLPLSEDEAYNANQSIQMLQRIANKITGGK